MGDGVGEGGDFELFGALGNVRRGEADGER